MNKLTAGAACLCLLAALAARGDEARPEPGFTRLFDGKSLDGWHVMNKGQFSVKDGVIFLNKGSGWLRSDKEYTDFELRLDFRFVSKGADSGVFLRASKEGKNWPAKAYQVQTMDNQSLGQVFPMGLPGAKVKHDAAALKRVMKKTGEWQSYAITVRGKSAEVKLNGEVVASGEGLAEQPGYVGMQGEGGQLEFKNVRVRELK